MVINGSEITPNSTLTTPIAIVGGGMAGMAIATSLEEKGIDAIVIEAGHRDHPANSATFYSGEFSTHDDRGNSRVQNEYLLGSRLSQFGGSANHWGGVCSTLDDLDFSTRDWVPLSGWPIKKEVLAPWYEKAANFLGIQRFDNLIQTPEVQRQKYLKDDNAFSAAYYQRSLFTGANVPIKNRKERLSKAKHIKIITESAVTELLPQANGIQITEAKIKTRAGHSFTLRARCFIVAGGGIESARLLLNSRSIISGGLGNHSDFVGRCFMEHMGFDLGHIFYLDADFIPAPIYSHRYDLPLNVRLKFSDQFQMQNQLLNASIVLTEEVPQLDEEARIGATVFDRLYARFNPPAHSDQNSEQNNKHNRGDEKVRYRRLMVLSEHAPNPESRILLSNELDERGLPKIKLKCTFSALDRESLLKHADLLTRQFGLRNMARFRFRHHDDLEKIAMHSGFALHHMGTTRMSADPKFGVVDSDCKVHNIENLFVASGGVFTTSGHAHPTYTITAMALRVADKVAQRVTSGS